MEFFNDIGSDPLKPSLFELVAQEQLRDLLQPALKYVLVVFAQQYPRYLIRVVNRHEEFYALIMFFVERHYLRNHDLPYIETNKTQAAVGGIPPGERLGDPDIRRSLLFLIGIPYFRAKAQDYYEELGGGISSDILEEGRLQRTFKALYPWINTAYETSLLVCNIAYLFDRTPFYRPWLAWIGIDIRRLGIDDFRAAQLAAAKAPGLKPTDSLRLLLPTAIFFIKFLEWWYSPNSPARSLSASPRGPAVPPPSMLPPHPRGIPFDKQAYGKCPICKDTINNATALPSGYVFCYRCAYDHVEKQGNCPVTLIPARVWQLRKVLI
ncbi:hypothetical protein L218DRAFT_327709 [Marasmius fiardii PR-910]|nr:hypothetical protein L218DRAFT_327709 [Marasmius fiardii PR-910]